MIKEHILTLAGLSRFLKRECHPKFDVALSKKINMWVHGFSQEASVYYDFKTYNKKDFLTEMQMYTKAVKINCGYTELMNNKLVFNEFISRYAKVAETYGYVEKGQFNLLINDCKPCDLFVLLKNKKKLILKKYVESSGNGVYLLIDKDNKIYINGTILSKNSAREFLQTLNGYLVCECVEQANYSNKIYSNSKNTIKLLTMIDPHSGEAFVAAAFHRFGTQMSYPVDNLGKGSCLVDIDLENGIMGKAYMIHNRKLIWIDKHPDTDAPLTGIQIPNWHSLLKEISALAMHVSYIKYIAWDVVLQDDGFVVIEGNANTDIIGIQPFRPLLLNDRVKEFYKYYGVIKGEKQ